MDLFERHREQLLEKQAPLADRMRPRTLDEFVGQDHIVGPGRLLRRAIQADQIASLIFHGPPGTGKTTLARIIAGTTRAHFISLNAVLAGVKEIRTAIDDARERRGQSGQRTILFVDEVHRFNKAQQDALLPWVENGTIVLVGATTENPYFEVNKALVSRSRLFQLKLLEEADLRRVALQALADPERGYGTRRVHLEADALAHLVDVSGGDARTLLNALELAVETTPPDPDGVVQVDLTVAEESIQRRAVLYDREGDAHFDTASAYIKSLRGSDPDAALYWLSRMLYAGEDPRFIFRRLLIQAAEDVGLADPGALAVVVSCAEAFDRVGLPEGRYHLTMATLYLATAPKSNSAMAFFDALATVERERAGEVPNSMKDSNRDKEGMGHGAGYLYPHAYRDHWVAQQYLPTGLQGQLFYRPTGQGYEGKIQLAVERRREEQLAAIADAAPEPQVFSTGPTDRATERWLTRTMSRQGEQLGRIRDRVLELAAPERHHLVLDPSARSGLLVWEALRRTPEGGVYACTASGRDAAALEEQALALAELRRPVVLQARIEEIKETLDRMTPEIRFDRIVSRNLLKSAPERLSVLTALKALLASGGRVVLAETVPGLASRPSELLAGHLDPDLHRQLREAEDIIYRSDPRLAWGVQELAADFVQAGLVVRSKLETDNTELRISHELVDRWFTGRTDGASYATQLLGHLSPNKIEQLRTHFQHLVGQLATWRTATVFCTTA